MRYFEVNVIHDFQEGLWLLKTGRFPLLMEQLTYDFDYSYYKNKQKAFCVCTTFTSTINIKTDINVETLSLLEKH